MKIRKTPPTYWWHSMVKTLAAMRASVWVLARALHHLDLILLRTTKGKKNLTSILTGLPIITLISTGAKSGLRRHSPLVGIQSGEEIILIASNFGQAGNPGWYYNLLSHPEAVIQSGATERSYIARQVEGKERERCWQMGVAIYTGYLAYRQRASHRQIPIMVMTPRED